METLDATPAGLDRAVRLLRQGQLVAFPTETVYGLGADAADPEAVRKIFEAKGRPADHPLIVHLPDAEAMQDWARDIPAMAWTLAEKFWPGPMALVLKKRPEVSGLITGGQDTIGLRVPAHPVAQKLLQAFGGALAAPSANRFGRISPTTAEHVIAEFGRDQTVAAVIDGGACPVGVESTILDLSGDQPRLLRPGMITVDEVEHVLGRSLQVAESGQGPRASGRLPSHYAPTTPLKLLPIEAIEAQLQRNDASLGVLAIDRTPARSAAQHWEAMPANPADYAHRLYAGLRRLDQLNLTRILVQQPPETAEWAAINDRLRRAAHDQS